MAFSGNQVTGLGPMALPFPRGSFSAKVLAVVKKLFAIGLRGYRVATDRRIG